ncbi:MAG: hypothetical protein MJ158_04635 [Alphaproteobacteria bacterium]|nr:hypothetical protein [Alphaproteobacteria bacterium]
MKKICFILLLSVVPCICFSATITNSKNFTNSNSYSTMYPYMSNQMRQKLNPGNTTNTDSQASKAISTLVKTSAIAPENSTRKVVARSAKKTSTNVVRSATNNNSGNKQVSKATSSTQRNVVQRRQATTKSSNLARAGTTNNNVNRNVVRRANVANRSATTSVTSTTGNVSSQRCFSDYVECMESYCKREDTAYNRCYCSAKLAQIDSQYKSKIDDLVLQIIKLKNSENVIWSDEEMAEYWANTMGQYSDKNYWTEIDDALNIDWASMESRVRGQNAFTAGHTYCIQHLRGCYYMSNNMRDAYKSEIARDCAIYEENLQRIQAAAESIIEGYK